MSNNSKYVLNEISKGLQMGIDSISNVSKKVEDSNLKEDLLFQSNEYNNLLARVKTEMEN